ncbi:hypothetical protein [Nocardioides convexus]|nr:hypothetical protein [Nocardioides convexus]
MKSEGASTVGRRGGKAGDYEDWTVEEPAQAGGGDRHRRPLRDAQERA